MVEHGEDGLGRGTGDGRPSYGEALVARAGATDREARFASRLARVEQARRRRRSRRLLVRVLVVPAVAVSAVLVVLLVAAVTGEFEVTGTTQLWTAGIGAVLGAIGPIARDRLAARRGPEAWDWHRERYVLLGDPSRRVRDADRPDVTPGGPPPPPPRR